MRKVASLIRRPLRGLCEELLRRMGLDVLAAADGRQAVDLYRERQAEIDVVLLDLTMPRMNGEEAYEELRQINPDVPVILASGYSRSDVATRFEGKDLAGCLQKPYTPGKLCSLLARLLPARQENAGGGGAANLFAPASCTGGGAGRGSGGGSPNGRATVIPRDRRHLWSKRQCAR